MQNSQQKIKYFAYNRKSSEDTERQKLSIPSQIAKTKEMFGHLDIVEFLQEEKSAFFPYARPVFASMIERIKIGEAQGIIVWHPDRLSRNEIDAATITYMLRTGEIRDLKFGSYHFDNSPEGIWMLQMALSQSQYDSAKKGRDVKRGLHTKAEMGMFPGPAPTGYKNDKFNERGKKQIYPDPERWALCRRMVDEMLKGIHNPNTILKMANEGWGFRMPNGKKMSRSTIYRMFTNTAYYAVYEYPAKSGVWHKGTYEKLMTPEEYDRIQVILGRKGKPRPKTHIFAFTGVIQCGECGAMVTAEEKIKRQKNGNIHIYIYYHCTKRINPNCTQKSIRAEELEKQIKKTIDQVNIPEDLHDFALKWAKAENAKVGKTTHAVLDNQHKAYKKCLKTLEGLVKMRANEEIDEDVFKTQQAPLVKEKKQWEEIFSKTGKQVDEWLKKANEVFTFATDCKARFEKGDAFKKKEILSRLGSHLSLKDGFIDINLEKTLIPVKSLVKENKRLEPLVIGKNREQIEQIYAQDARMLRD